MKKILGMLCIFALVTFVFAGCHHKNTAETNPGEAGTTATGTTGETGTAGTTGETGTAGTTTGTTGETGTAGTGSTGTTGETGTMGTTPGTETPGTATGTATGEAGTSGSLSATPGAASSDTQIESQVRQSLQQQNIDISNVTITVNAGVVNLSGQVTSQAEADRIAAAVRSVTGVKQVQNNLTIKH